MFQLGNSKKQVYDGYFVGFCRVITVCSIYTQTKRPFYLRFRRVIFGVIFGVPLLTRRGGQKRRGGAEIGITRTLPLTTTPALHRHPPPPPVFQPSGQAAFSLNFFDFFVVWLLLIFCFYFFAVVSIFFGSILSQWGYMI